MCVLLAPAPKRKVNGKDLAWADQIDAVRVHVLDIPDDYPFMDPELIQLLRDSVEPLL